jgi:hypothetical protein
LVDSPVEEGWKFENQRVMEKARKLVVEEMVNKKQPKRKKPNE